MMPLLNSKAFIIRKYDDEAKHTIVRKTLRNCGTMAENVHFWWQRCAEQDLADLIMWVGAYGTNELFCVKARLFCILKL